MSAPGRPEALMAPERDSAQGRPMSERAPGLLAGLYPHLAPASAPPPDGAALDAALLDSIRHKSAESARVQQAFVAAQAPQLLRAAHVVAQAYRGGGRLYTFGNGGSSCDSAHLAVEFQHPVTTGRPALPAHDLARDAAMITAVGNDVGIAEIYARQVAALVRAGDAVVAISTSGNSANLLRGVEQAHAQGAATVALTGGDGGALARSPAVDLALVVPSDSIHRVQETHVLLYHVLWDVVHTLLARDRQPATGGAR